MQTNPNRPPFAPISLVLATLLLLSTGCTPSGPKALLQGEELIRKGKYDAAIEKLELATNLLPNEARAWNYLGVARNRAGQFADARLAYERALQLDRDLAAARFNLGKMYMDQGVPISALEQLSTFVMLDQKSVEGRVLMGDANLELLRYDQAMENYSAALRLQRDVPAAYNGIGLIYMNQGDPRKAYQLFAEALKYDPDYAPAILNLAVVLQTKLNAKPVALAKYKEYLAKAPNAPNAEAIRGVVQRLDLELNPPLEEEKPIVVAKVETNQVNVAPPAKVAETKPAEVEDPKLPVAATNVEPESVTPKVDPKKEPVIEPVEKKPEVVKVDPPKKVEPPPAKKTETPKVAVVDKKPEVTTPPAKKVEPLVEGKEPEVVTEKKPDVEPTKPVLVTKEPPVQKPKTEPVVSKPIPEPVIEEEPLEVVELDADEIAATGDIPVPQATPSEPPVAVVEDAIPDLPVANSSVTIEAPVETEAEAPKKRGFFQRINPVNLFRDDESEKNVRSEEIVTPLPPSNSTPRQGPPPATRSVATAGTYTSLTPMSAKTGTRRYSYSQSGAPRPGDRAASERLFQRGLDSQAQLNPGRAASYFASAAMADPSYFPAQYNLGLLSYQTGQTMKSLSAFETALALDPTSVEARYNFALALQKTKYPLDAAAELKKILDENPDDLRAHLLLGNVYAQDLDDIDGARIEYQEVLRLDSDHAQAPAIRAWINEHR